MENLSVLLIEDEPAVRKGLTQALELAGISVQACEDAETALDGLTADFAGVVVSDVKLPGQDGLAVLSAVQTLDASIPVILITSHGEVSMAVQAMRDGAYDFLEKPFPSKRLVDVVNRALEKRALVLENLRLRQLLERQSANLLIGGSPAMVKLRAQVASIGPTAADILIHGETGAGKERLARALHDASGRRGPFVAINCGAIPETVFESEIFGHESGAFTGATKQRIGKIEFAANGTLFLDEIESMPLSLQVKMLRVLQERQLERLGGNQAIDISCRVIAASKADLKAESEAARFRADLYYRLNVVTLDLPPLRARREDIPLLVIHFGRQAAKRYDRPEPAWDQAMLGRWMQHDWPGNVRELRNAVDRVVLGLDAEPTPLTATSGQPPLPTRLEAYERSLIETELRQTDGNVAEAAERLGIPRKTLYDKLQRLAIRPEAYRE
ncbi:sigma-54-dependent transcriptional regulator [Mangrovitalea sediminis]|uniref:sigma-54-dependent transcriptional regulator n=1 Tax=Mangrovitalea sediminis TaxID=1982043 RepID=UPI000BE51005|nr:sigma-54 dependent transcriptional regulator [Mangrovitalea sediminis]